MNLKTQQKKKYSKKKKIIKTFGIKFLELIIKSEKFLKDFKFFLMKDLVNLYLQTIDTKFCNLLKKLFLIFENKKKNFGNFEKKKNFQNFEKKNHFGNFENDFEFLFKKTCFEYFIRNNQCKIPWTIMEIRDAIFRVLKVIQNYEKVTIC